jgi:hypothetical protein
MKNIAHLLLLVAATAVGCHSTPNDPPAQPLRTGKHLFILSGQSNMAGLKPELSFTPAVAESFGRDNVLIAKAAYSGASIRSWAKSNHEDPPPTAGRVPKVRGDFYPKLVNQIQAAVQGQELQTVTLVWMQGESDLNNTNYTAYLDELYVQLQADVGFEDINFVIGRISDAGLDNPKRLAGRLNIRKVQQAYAEQHPRGAWVDTDDLNDRIKDGKLIHDLHYTPEGYVELGKRFAEASIELIKETRR